jgi:hypothetical protein
MEIKMPKIISLKKHKEYLERVQSQKRGNMLKNYLLYSDLSTFELTRRSNISEENIMKVLAEV